MLHSSRPTTFANVVVDKFRDNFPEKEIGTYISLLCSKVVAIPEGALYSGGHFRFLVDHFFFLPNSQFPTETSALDLPSFIASFTKIQSRAFFSF
jgi:hypothetical protein